MSLGNPWGDRPHALAPAIGTDSDGPLPPGVPDDRHCHNPGKHAAIHGYRRWVNTAGTHHGNRRAEVLPCNQLRRFVRLLVSQAEFAFVAVTPRIDKTVAGEGQRVTVVLSYAARHTLDSDVFQPIHNTRCGTDGILANPVVTECPVARLAKCVQSPRVSDHCRVCITCTDVCHLYWRQRLQCSWFSFVCFIAMTKNAMSPSTPWVYASSLRTHQSKVMPTRHSSHGQRTEQRNWRGCTVYVTLAYASKRTSVSPRVQLSVATNSTPMPTPTSHRLHRPRKCHSCRFQAILLRIASQSQTPVLARAKGEHLSSIGKHAGEVTSARCLDGLTVAR